jgi:hypothetical protein
MAEQRVSVSPAEVQTYLGVMKYPASKQDLIEHARKNNAPDDLVRLLNELSDQQFHTPADVSRAIVTVE